jgi:DNA-binding CsgD family transcriptional regulator
MVLPSRANGKATMTVIHAHDAPSVWVTGPDATLRGAIARLLSCDPSIHVRGTSEGRVTDASTASVVIDETMLEQLKTLSIGDFIAMIKSLPGTPPAPSERHLRPLPSDGDMRTLLSERELEVVRLVADGLSNKQISRRMELSDKTVKNHVSHILAKLQLTARTQVAVHALRAGLV